METENLEIETSALKAFVESVDPGVLQLLNESDCKRFLRARKMDVEKAVLMANNWGVWWRTISSPDTGATPQTVLDNIVDPFEHIYEKYCPLTHSGFDKEGCPIYWEQSGVISGVFPNLAEHISLDEMLNRHIRNQVQRCYLFCLYVSYIW
jgi:hypothetical protein